MQKAEPQKVNSKMAIGVHNAAFNLIFLKQNKLKRQKTTPEQKPK